MNKVFILLLAIINFISCRDYNDPAQREGINKATTEFLEIIDKDYELYKPSHNIKAVLVLFGGYPQIAEDIRREFKILEVAKNNNIALVLFNYSRKLWLEENEKFQLANKIQEVFEKNNLPNNNIYFGGYSSGGNISLLMSNFIMGIEKFNIKPKGVFIVDSPIDLIALYNSSMKNIERNFSEVSVMESKFLINLLGESFGIPKEQTKNYEDKAVFTSSTNNIDNLSHLKNTKIRLYTEPDTLWWKQNRMADYEQMNAFYIKKLSESLKKANFQNVEYIPTKNRGYRANGERHPHSWSIVDEKDLVKWMLNK